MIRAVLALALVGFACKRDKASAPEPSSSPIALSVAGGQDASGAPIVDDLVSVPAGSGRGRLLTCDKPPAAIDTDEPVDDHAIQTEAFQIDRATVTCASYAGCVQAGACKPLDAGAKQLCHFDRAVVTRADARAFCAWRGYRLPTYFEWQRAARGDRGDVYVTGATAVQDRLCTHPTDSRHELLGRCAQEAPSGMRFHTRSAEPFELTASEGCRMSNGQKVTGDAAVSLSSDRLDLVSFQADVGEFRCARNR